MIELSEKAENILKELSIIVPVLQTTETITIQNNGDEAVDNMIHEFSLESQLKDNPIADLHIFTVCPLVKKEPKN